MDKKLLGDWGSTLDDRGYAEAVAGLGVHAARPMGIGNRIRWRSRLLEAAGSPDWRDVAGLDPVTATNLWRRRVLNLSVSSRILDWPSLEDPDGLLSTLAYADPRSLIVEPSVVDDGAQRSWRWPLRVGVLPGADLAGLEHFFALNTAPGLFRVEALDGARETCDLLLLPRTFRDSLFGSYDAFEGLRARATVVMTNLDYDNVLGGQARMEAGDSAASIPRLRYRRAAYAADARRGRRSVSRARAQSASRRSGVRWPDAGSMSIGHRASWELPTSWRTRAWCPLRIATTRSTTKDIMPPDKPSVSFGDVRRVHRS